MAPHPGRSRVVVLGVDGIQDDRPVDDRRWMAEHRYRAVLQVLDGDTELSTHAPATSPSSASKPMPARRTDQPACPTCPGEIKHVLEVECPGSRETSHYGQNFKAMTTLSSGRHSEVFPARREGSEDWRFFRRAAGHPHYVVEDGSDPQCCFEPRSRAAAIGPGGRTPAGEAPATSPRADRTLN